MLKEGKIIAWDYKNHQQFELEIPYFLRLLEISDQLNILDATQSIDHELMEAKLISDNQDSIEWQWDILSKIFHIGTQLRKQDIENKDYDDSNRFISEYINDCEQIAENSIKLNIEKAGEIINLPNPDFKLLSALDFLSVLKNRRTYRSFSEQKVDLKVLSTLLKVVFGEISDVEKDFEENGFQKIGLRKTSPSGGGIHPTEAYLLILNVDGLKKGVYHYRAHCHQLSVVHLEDYKNKLTRIFCGQYFSQDLPFGIFLTSCLNKIWQKYPHSRAYRIALLDVGHISQTFQLVSTALGLNPWLSGAFCDEEVSELLKLDDTTEYPIFFVGAGFGQSSFDKVSRGFQDES